MYLKKIALGLVAGVGIVGAAAFMPGKEAKADGSWDCFKIDLASCGCKEKCFNNCTCPTTTPPTNF